jgi:hypothetical protein
MHYGNHCAPDLKVKVAGNEELSDGPGEVGIVGLTQQVLHLLRKWNQACAKGEEDRSAKPHCGIQNTHKSQEPDHGFTVGKAASNAKPGILAGAALWLKNISRQLGQLGSFALLQLDVRGDRL